jgi:hypothetical protein
MRQFTMNIDDGLLLAAKKRALESGRTVSDIVRDLLAREVGWTEPRETAPPGDDQIRDVLFRYSDGRLSRHAAMNQINLEPHQYADFVELMRRLSVPWPQIDRNRIDQEAEIVAQAIRGASDEN